MTHEPPLGKLKWLHQAEREDGPCLWCGKNQPWGPKPLCPAHEFFEERQKRQTKLSMTLGEFQATREVLVSNGSHPEFLYLRRTGDYYAIQIQDGPQAFVLQLHDVPPIQSNNLGELEVFLYFHAQGHFL